MGLTLGDATAQPLPVSSTDEATRFITRVMPAAAPGRRIGLHWFPNDKKSWDWATANDRARPPMKGQAFLTPEDAVGFARWLERACAQNNEPGPDLYLCMALCGMEVAQTAKGGRAKFIPTRQMAAHRASKTLYVDLDVLTPAKLASKKAKGYPDKASLRAAMAALVANGSVPPPTVQVDSGNGEHFHWVLDRELSYAEWKTLATAWESYLIGLGLQVDPGIVTDAVRVLRLPGTHNMKDLANPLPTALVGAIDPNDIPVAQFEALLGVSVAAGAAGVAQPRMVAQVLSTPQALPEAFRVHTPFVPVPAEPEFSSGVDPNVHLPQHLDFRKVLAECPSLGAMHARKGAGDPGVLWMLAILAVTFLPEPDRLPWAHALSSGHAQYTPADTEAKLQEKLNARLGSGGRIGWPSCTAFSNHCTECKTCPLFGKITSPLSLGVVTPVVVPAGVPATVVPTELPQGFFFEARGVMTMTGDDESIPTLAVPHHIEDACIEEKPDGAIFSARILHAHNPPTRVRIPIAAATAWRDEATKALGAAHIALLPEQIPLARRLFVSWIQQLQAQQANAIVRDPFGWVKTRDGAPGFAFDNRVFHASGEEASAQSDDQFRLRYRSTGTMEVWKEAAGLIMGMNRIELQAAVATAFAAPLMKLTGLHGVIISLYASKSGVQKSSALALAQSVWGDPKTGMSRLDDTANAVSRKMGMLRHLPIYWDELQTRDQTAAFAKLAFGLTQGIEKIRLNTDIKLRASGEWATALICGSNNSVREVMLAEQASGSAAGIARVLEFEVKPVELSTSAAESAITLAKANENFGLAGVEYARLLASMESKLQPALSAVAKSFEQAVNSNAEQRYWIVAASTIYLGASLANRLTHNGAPVIQFPLPKLHAFLCDTIRQHQQARIDDVVDMGSLENATRVVQGYIDHCRATNVALETNTVPSGPGRPGLVEHRFISSDAARLLRAPTAHIVHDDGMVRFKAEEFRRWVTQDKRLPFDAVKRDLEQYGALVEHRARWAGGTQWSGAITKFYQIDVHYGRTPLGGRIGLGK